MRNYILIILIASFAFLSCEKEVEPTTDWDAVKHSVMLKYLDWASFMNARNFDDAQALTYPGSEFETYVTNARNSNLLFGTIVTYEMTIGTTSFSLEHDDNIMTWSTCKETIFLYEDGVPLGVHVNEGKVYSSVRLYGNDRTNPNDWRLNGFILDESK